MTHIEKHILRPGESRTFDVELSDYLYEGATISSASAAVTTKLGGTALTVGSPVVSGSVVYVKLTAQAGAALAPDRHVVKLSLPIDNPATIPDETPIHTIEISIRESDD